jgi:hypothetical protein
VRFCPECLISHGVRVTKCLNKQLVTAFIRFLSNVAGRPGARKNRWLQVWAIERWNLLSRYPDGTALALHSIKHWGERHPRQLARLVIGESWTL